MKNIMKNKKGFTLVELLAVIVILALIMGIAVVAMSGVIGSSQKNSVRRTAASIIDGVRSQLTLAGELKSGVYEFSNSILEKGGVTSPLGGNYVYATTGTAVTGTNGVYKKADTITNVECKSSTTSYVIVDVPASGGKTNYYICLTSGSNNDFVAGSESDILADKDTVIIGNSVADKKLNPSS